MNNKTPSQKTKDRISKSLTGRSLSKEHRKNLSLSLVGRKAWNKGISGICKKNSGSFKKGQFAKDKHWNWKGGISSEEQIIRTSVEYLRWRKKVLKRDIVCVLCGSNENLCVDHVKSFRDYPKLRMDFKNGRTLCQKCHSKTANYASKNLIKYRKRDSKGRFI